MDSKARIELIRKGNEAFNAKDFTRAKELFTQAEYSDGLIRLGDHFMYERRLPLLAYGYYLKAGARNKIEDLHRRMVAAIGEWIGTDKIKPEFQSAAPDKKRPAYVDTDAEGMVRVPVSGPLLQQARRILDGKR